MGTCIYSDQKIGLKMGMVIRALFIPSLALALGIWSGFGGRMGFDARSAAENLHGERPEASPGVRHASVKPRQRPERSLKVLASRYGHGSRQCGM